MTSIAETYKLLMLFNGNTCKFYRITCDNQRVVGTFFKKEHPSRFKNKIQLCYIHVYLFVFVQVVLSGVGMFFSHFSVIFVLMPVLSLVLIRVNS